MKSGAFYKLGCLLNKKLEEFIYFFNNLNSEGWEIHSQTPVQH